MASCFENINRCIREAFYVQDKSLSSLYFKNNRARTEESVHSPSCIKNVQQNMLVQGALVLFLFDTIAILPHFLIYNFAFLV